MQRRTCEQCGATFDGRSNRARFCSANCRVRAHRGAPKGGAAVPVALQVPTADLRASVAAALAGAKRDTTPSGQMCLLLAQRAMDADARALPALTRELSLRLSEALAGASGAVADPVDELRKRRERRGVA